jgi:hypothetical protein
LFFITGLEEKLNVETVDINPDLKLTRDVRALSN